MPIYFACTNCKKSLFAQENYAGRAVLCPSCSTRNIIPPAPGQTVTSSDPLVVDMEVAPAETPPAECVPPNTNACSLAAALQAAGAEAQVSALPMAETPPVTPAAAASDAAEPTKKCPMCAETIKAAARKCRFCNTVLDESLRGEEEKARRDHVMLGMLAVAERSTQVWRAISVIVTGCTVGWLVLLTVNLFFAGTAALPLAFFNMLLIAGLFWSTRQMRHGPHNVFLAAACAVLLCMPLNIAMGLPLVELDAEQLKQMQKQNPQFTEEMLRAVAGMVYSGVGLFFSIPLWIATLKVAGLQRLRQMAAGPGAGAKR